MIRKQYDSEYYDEQNKRSGLIINSNKLPQYLNIVFPQLPSSFYFLDIGCRGIAKTVEYMLGYTKHSYGFDIGERASVKWETLVAFNNNLMVHDAHEPFPYEFKFDLMSISHTLEHCYDPELVIKNMYTHLNNGGIVWSTVPIEHDATHKPHYCVFQSHDEHKNIYSKLFTVIWDMFDNGNSYLFIQRKDVK